jgi:hypothetical protein
MKETCIKDFLLSLVLQKIEHIQENRLQKRLKKAIQQSKEGKIKYLGSFARFVQDEI